MNAARPTDMDKQGLVAAFERIARRLEDVLERERQDLRRNDHERFAEYARQKDLLHMDILRLSETFGPRWPHHQALRETMERLKASLDENARLLELHMKAAGEIAGYLEDTMRRMHSDGTYSRSAGRRKKGYGSW